MTYLIDIKNVYPMILGRFCLCACLWRGSILTSDLVELLGPFTSIFMTRCLRVNFMVTLFEQYCFIRDNISRFIFSSLRRVLLFFCTGDLTFSVTLFFSVLVVSHGYQTYMTTSCTSACHSWDFYYNRRSSCKI